MVCTVFSFEDFNFGGAHQVYHDEDVPHESWSAHLQGYHPLGFQDHVPAKESQLGIDLIGSDHDFSDFASSGSAQSFGKAMSTVEAYLEKALMSHTSELQSPKYLAYHLSLQSHEFFEHGQDYNGGDDTSSPKSMTDPVERRGELSTEEIMRIAATNFIQSSAHPVFDPSILLHPSGLSSSSLSDDESKKVYLATLLLLAAEKVNNQQYDGARNLLGECYSLSSKTGNPVERVVHYFSVALHDKVNRATGRQPSTEKDTAAQAVIQAMLSAQPVQLVIQEKLPFLQLMQFTSIQTIIDSVALANRIHMIDLSIRHGFQWIILLQSLATRTKCRIHYLKISAVGTNEDVISTTGKSLVSYARTLSIHLIFKAVIVSDMNELKQDMFEVEEGEVVGAYSSMDMNPMIVRPKSLENLMRVIRKLRPSIMTVVDIEAKHNSLSFINRFAEALFFYSSYFDCLGSFMDKDDSIRFLLEGSFHSHGIRNIVATEGRERVVRHVGIEMWRAYFARFGLEETELNEWSPYQASLLVKQFHRGSSCSLDKNGESLIIGWKGTPIVFVSAWKFR